MLTSPDDCPLSLTPSNDVVLQPSPKTQPQQERRGWCNRLKRMWHSLQVSHSGKLSVERLLALEEYSRSVSFVRVLLVCCATPLPMVFLVLLQECVPLQNPFDGWYENYGFWIRTGILGGVVAIGIATFATRAVSGVKLSSLQFVLLFASHSIAYPASVMVVAEQLAFPIPFMILSTGSIYMALYLGLFCAIAGKKVLYHIIAQRDEMLELSKFSSAQFGMAVAYAVYQVLFDAVTDTSFELPTILLLPLIKLAMKNVVSRCISRKPDMVPEAVVFTVEFFNAFYLATCMQNTSSTATVVMMIAIDVVQLVIALRSLHRRTDTILARLHQACGSNTDSLLPAVGSLCRDLKKFEQQHRTTILLRSCLPHHLSSESQDLLNKLENVPENGPHALVCCQSPCIADTHGPIRSATRTIFAKLSWKSSRDAVTPIFPQELPQNTSTTTEDSEILSEVLEVMFTSECHILTEYMETIIPVLYGSFIVLVVHLPSAHYHTDLSGVTLHNVDATVHSIFLYALLEFVSFAMLVWLMLRNCRLGALHHLAFVLETQTALVQVRLLTWVLITLSFRVVHFGADFTFRFTWLK